MKSIPAHTPFIKIARNAWVFALVVLCFGSCNKRTTTDILPDSCNGITTINIPDLLPKLLKNKEVIDSISHLLGVPVDEIGLNYFEPAYFFQKEFEGTKSFFLLVGLDDEKAFTIQLAKKFPKNEITEHGNFRSVAISPVLLVWSDEFLICQTYNPMAAAPDAEKLSTLLNANLNRTSQEMVSDSADISFHWKIAESAPNLPLPPLELEMRGSANWDDNHIVLNAKIEEHQYMALLKPFLSQSEDAQKEQGIQVVMWPAIESILLQILGYGGNAFENEMNPKIINLITRSEHPFELYLPEKDTFNLLHDAQIKTRFKSEKDAVALESEIQAMLPNSLLANYKIARYGSEVVFHYQISKPHFTFEKVDSDPKRNLILTLNQSNTQTNSRLIVYTKGGGHYEVEGNFEHPERLRSNSLFKSAQHIDTKSVLNHFLP